MTLQEYMWIHAFGIGGVFIVLSTLNNIFADSRTMKKRLIIGAINDPDHPFRMTDQNYNMYAIVLISLFWTLALGCLLLASPFIGLHYLVKGACMLFTRRTGG